MIFEITRKQGVTCAHISSFIHRALSVKEFLVFIEIHFKLPFHYNALKAKLFYWKIDLLSNKMKIRV